MIPIGYVVHNTNQLVTYNVCYYNIVFIVLKSESHNFAISNNLFLLFPYLDSLIAQKLSIISFGDIHPVNKYDEDYLNELS